VFKFGFLVVKFWKKIELFWKFATFNILFLHKIKFVMYIVVWWNNLILSHVLIYEKSWIVEDHCFKRWRFPNSSRFIFKGIALYKCEILF
jgi:hypothetical protein